MMVDYEVKEYEVLAETREHNGNKTTITHLLLPFLGWTDVGTVRYLVLTKRARVYYLYRGLKKVYVTPLHEDGRDLLRVEDDVLDLKDFGVAA